MRWKMEKNDNNGFLESGKQLGYIRFFNINTCNDEEELVYLPYCGGTFLEPVASRR